jgi:hypothetical protein
MIDPITSYPATRRYLDLVQKFRTAVPETIALRTIRGHKRYFHSPGLMEFQRAMVLPGEWLVVVGDQVYCDFFLQTPMPPLTAYLNHFDFGHDDIELIFEPPSDPPISQAFLLGGCRNYSHWLLDYLPRLALRADAGLPLLVNGPLLSFQLESLKLLGVAADRLLPLAYPSTVSVQRLLYPSLSSSSFTPPHSFQPSVLAWLRDAFAPLMASGRRDRKLFISRGEEVQDHRRRLLNHDEIAAIARRHDFEIVSPEHLSFADQIRLFSQASVIAGAHGAGFANMAFAPKGAELVELIGPRLSHSAWSMGYVRLAQLLEQGVTRVVGQANERDAVAFDHLPYETYTIDPEEFATVLSGHRPG